MNITIKKEFMQTALAFGQSGLPLGKRSQEDLLEMAILAKRSKDPSLLQYFEKLPNLSKLLEAQTEQQFSEMNISRPGAPVQKIEVPKEFTGTDPKELLIRK